MARGGHPAGRGQGPQLGGEWQLLDKYIRDTLPGLLEERDMAGTAQQLRSLPKIRDARVMIVVFPILTQITLFTYDQLQEHLREE